LLGPSGAMAPDAAEGLDRCYWYKSDFYYPDSRRFVPGQDPHAFLSAPPGGTNFQLAPLARTWYEVLDAEGSALPLAGSQQRFETESGVLHSTLRLGDMQLDLRTWLAPGLPALCFDLTAPHALAVRVHLAPGLWPQDGEQTDPVSAVEQV